VRTGRSAILAATALAALLVGACEFAPAVPEPVPTSRSSGTPPASATAPPAAAGAPSISIDEQQFQLLNGVWTFSGRVDPRGSDTSVTIQIGHDITNPTAFVEERSIADDVTEAGPIEAEVRTPDAVWLCVRFRAVNAAGDGVTPTVCHPTDLPGARPSGGPSPAPSPSG
jgi:hypothetical protein